MTIQPKHNDCSRQDGLMREITLDLWGTGDRCYRYQLNQSEIDLAIERNGVVCPTKAIQMEYFASQHGWRQVRNWECHRLICKAIGLPVREYD